MRCLQSNGKKTSDKENNMAVQKPTKQQIAQAKARAGGNNPIKVTNAGLKKLGSAALIAASFTPVGRAAKIATTAVKVSNAVKTAKATKTLATPKSAVKVKPAAKPVGNPPNNTKAWESVLSSASRGGVGRTMGKAKDARVAKSTKQTADTARTANASKIKVNSSNSVKVLPRKTAPKTDLSNRGTQLTRAQRSERAQDYQFDKSLGKYYSNQDRIAGTHPSELAKGSRGEGVKSARKTAAIKKEAKPVVKINSQRNLKAK
jgi:hypothetical protein